MYGIHAYDGIFFNYTCYKAFNGYPPSHPELYCYQFIKYWVDKYAFVYPLVFIQTKSYNKPATDIAQHEPHNPWFNGFLTHFGYFSLKSY